MGVLIVVIGPDTKMMRSGVTMYSMTDRLPRYRVVNDNQKNQEDLLYNVAQVILCDNSCRGFKTACFAAADHSRPTRSDLGDPYP